MPVKAGVSVITLGENLGRVSLSRKRCTYSPLLSFRILYNLIAEILKVINPQKDQRDDI